LTQGLAKHALSASKALSHTDGKPAVGSIIEPSDVEETPEQLEKRLRRLMGQSKVVVFMKGSPDTPKCGFSKQTMAIMKDNNVEFTHFDILTDSKVRQGTYLLPPPRATSNFLSLSQG
jgi:hypothetical protein